MLAHTLSQPQINSSIHKKQIWTYSDYYKLDDDKRYEVIEGELWMSPSPLYIHQKIQSKLGFILQNYVNEKSIGEILFSPLDVVLSKTNVLQPDIIYISNDNRKIIQRRGLFGAPDMVVEIISPSTTRRDLQVKKTIYEKFNINEFWVAYPDEKILENYIIKNMRYELFSSVITTGIIKSQALNDELEIGNIWE
jgi:Uma2 family endonuclease